MKKENQHLPSTRREFIKKSMVLGAAASTTPLVMAANQIGQQSTKIGTHANVLPTDPRYPSLLLGSNLRFMSFPTHVSVCSAAEEVYTAVREAITHNKRITVRSGGHCYENFVSNDQGVIIDIGNMDRIYKEGDFYVVEAGANLGRTYEKLFKEWGVILPGGSCFGVGMGGHVCGGGFGALSRRYGLSSDYLAGVELISFNEWGGQAVYPKRYMKGADNNANDVVWAHQGGGGGNFGIVTKYYFKDLPKVPKFTHIQQISLPWASFDYSSFQTLIRKYGQFWQNNNDENNRFNEIHTSLNISNSVAGEGNISLQIISSGENPTLIDEFIDALFSAAQLEIAQIGVPSINHTGMHSFAADNNRPVPYGSYISIPWWLATEFGGGGGSARAKYKSAYMNAEFPEHQIQTLWDNLNQGGYLSPGGLVQISSYGGKINALDGTDTAVSHRQSIMKLQYQTYWQNPAQDAYHIGWINQLFTNMYTITGPISDGTMDGCYVNYADVDIDNWQYLYYKDNYKKLQSIKTQLDPKNRLNHAQSIEVLS